MRSTVLVYTELVLMHVRTYKHRGQRSTRFDYDNTRLRVGFSWLLLKLLFAKLTIKSSHLTDSEESVVEFDQFILCVTNNNNNILINFVYFYLYIVFNTVF